MHLEFLGLSGVGKTEVINKCLHNKESTLLNRIDLVKLPKSKFLWASISALFLLFRISIISLRSAKYMATSKAGIKLLLSLGARKSSINRLNKKNNTLLIDSGVLMPLIESVMVDDLLWDDNLIKSILSVVPLPDVVIYVHVDEDISYKRFLNRGHTKYSYSGSMDGVYINRFKFSNANKCLFFVMGYLKTKLVRTIYYKNERQIDCKMLVSKIATSIEVKY
jgi:hypothetical protein